MRYAIHYHNIFENFTMTETGDWEFIQSCLTDALNGEIYIMDISYTIDGWETGTEIYNFKTGWSE